MLEGTYFYECACGSVEHTLSFTLDLEDKDDKLIYTSVFLNNYNNVFVRIWKAIKYIFGYKCQYGHWDSFTMREEDVFKFEKMIKEYKKGAK